MIIDDHHVPEPRKRQCDGPADPARSASYQRDGRRCHVVRQRLNDGITSRLEDVYLNGHSTERLPGNLNLSFAYVEGAALMMGMKDVAVSSGSACTSASLEPSYVLKALGVGDELAHSSLRLSLGKWTTDEQVEYAIGEITKAVKKLRLMSPLYDMHKEGIDLSKVEWAHH